MTGRFEGWYHKLQGSDRSLALIPGRAEDGAFVMVAAQGQSYHIPYPLSQYRRDSTLRVGDNTFSRAGVSLSIHRPELELTGEIRYGALTPIRGDIMGPFRFVPMECRHEILSMGHRLSGSLLLNGEVLDFGGGLGYLEADRGRSFPQSYTWVQGMDAGGAWSVTASAARIPVCGLHFWGCICIVRLEGREYRLATYRGARLLRCAPGALELEQGRYRLSVVAEPREDSALSAPRGGRMSRVIRESLACPARFTLTRGDRVLFRGDSDRASYEYAME